MIKLIFFIITSVSSLALGADFYQGIRQMGMGGASIAVVNDETALLLNPNGLGRLREPYVTIIDPEVTTNTGSVDSVQNLSVINGADTQKIYNELAGKHDQRYFFRGQMFPSFANRNYGIGFLAKYDVQATRLGSNDFLNLNYVSDWAAVGGYNLNFWGGVVKLGANVKLIDRAEYIGDVDPATQGLNLKNFAVGGLGVGADVGLTVVSPTDFLPTFSLVARDIGDTSFSMGKSLRSYSSTIDPQKIPQSINVAMGLFPIHSHSSRSSFTVEYDKITATGDAIRKLHVGYELNLGDHLFFRAGYNKGYFTSGFEWANPFFQFQLAYYGEEIGTDALPVRDNRVSTKFLLRF